MTVASASAVIRFRLARADHPPRRLVRAMQIGQADLMFGSWSGVTLRYWQRLSFRERLRVLEVFGL